MSNDKIHSGLNAIAANDPTAPQPHQRALTLETLAEIVDPELEALIGANDGFDVNALTLMAASAIEKGATVATIVRDGTAAIDGKANVIRAEFKAMGLSNVAETERAIAKKFGEARKEIADKSKAARAEALATLLEAHHRVTKLERWWRTPAQVLDRVTLLDESRAKYSAALAHAAPAQIRSLAELAVATKNKPLAAALLSRLETLPKASRPYSTQALAHAMIGSEFRTALTAIERTKHAYLTARRANDAYVMGRRDPLGRIEAGLRDKRIATLAAAP